MDDSFKYIFVNETFRILIEISLKFVPKRPVDHNPSIGLDNGLAPSRRQTIIRTNGHPIHWRTYAALGGDGLKLKSYSAYLQIHHQSSALLVFCKVKPPFMDGFLSQGVNDRESISRKV